MAQYGPTDYTLQVTTGNFRTTMDVFNASAPNNGAVNSLGAALFDNASTAANPNGAPTKYRYVRYQSTANPAVQAAPAAVWWKDATYTVVTGVSAEAWGGASSFAGLLMPNSTDKAGLTAAILNGNFVWIAVAGIVTGVVFAAGAAGAQLFASQADWTTTGGFSSVAVGGATVGRQAAFTFGASPNTVYVNAESI